MTTCPQKAYPFGPLGPRGFLSNYPDDVVRVVNGVPVTKADILTAKRARQAWQLAAKRRNYDPILKPCFIWVFWTDGLSGFFKGWWLYVRTLRQDWRIETDSHLFLEIMRLFPCGYLPMIVNSGSWKEAFARTYAYPTRKRPDRQGLARARASINGRQLLSVSKWE